MITTLCGHHTKKTCMHDSTHFTINSCLEAPCIAKQASLQQVICLSPMGGAVFTSPAPEMDRQKHMDGLRCVESHLRPNKESERDLDIHDDSEP